MKILWTFEKKMKSSPCSKWMKEKFLVFFIQKCSLHIIGQDQTAQKGEKVNSDTQTRVCVNLNSNQCHKIRSFRFGIFSLAQTTILFLLIKPNSSHVCLPFRLLESGLPLWWSLPPMHFVIVFWFVIIVHCKSKYSRPFIVL